MPPSPEPLLAEVEADAALQEALDSERASLAAAARSPLTRSWLAPALASDAGSAELYALLEERVQAPSFLETVERACARARGGGRRVFYRLAAAPSPPPPQPSHHADDASAAAQPGLLLLSADVTSPEWWSLPAGVVSVEEEVQEGGSEEAEGGGGKSRGVKAVSATSSSPSSSSSSPSLLDGSYVIVSRDDVVDAVAHFIASYVASLPQARDLDPKALRSALATTLGELRRGKVRKLWAWGKWLYRAAALSYGAFGAYTNPWLARAVLAALWTSAKVMVEVAVGG